MSCTDEARLFMAEDFLTVECPPGCYLSTSAEFDNPTPGSYLDTASICLAAIDDLRVDGKEFSTQGLGRINNDALD